MAIITDAIPLPPIWEFPNEVLYRFNLFVLCECQGIDIRRLEFARECVRQDVFTDWPKED